MNGARGVIAVVGLVLLAGCTGGSDPATPSGSSAPATTAVVSPAPTAPVQAATPESAVEFVKYFWALYNYAYATYDTKPLEAISAPECTYCASTVDQVSALKAEGSRVQGFEASVLESVVPPSPITAGTLVTVSLRQVDGQLIRADGSREELPGYAKATFAVGVAWADGHWSIHGVDHSGG